jgi:hypothetical protein
MREIIQGIYCLYFETDDYQYYIGKSIDVLSRYSNHCTHLKAGTHHNINLQRQYVLRNVLPSMYIIEKVALISTLDNSEKYWIKSFDAYYNGMNSTPGGEGAYGEQNPFSLYSKDTYISIARELAYTDLTYQEIANKLQVSDRVIATIASGASHTWLASEAPEVYYTILSKVGTRNTNSLDKEIYKEILFLLANTDKRLLDISTELGVSNRIIERIAGGESHVYLKEQFPDEYTKMLSKKGNRKVLAARREPYPDIISPVGEIFSITNAREFCRAKGLQQSMLGMVLRGQALQHKGWKLA